MEGIEGEYPVSERGRKSRSADFPVRSIVRTPTCTQFAARLCERSFLRTGKSALRPPSLTGYMSGSAKSRNPRRCIVLVLVLELVAVFVITITTTARVI